MAEKNQIVKFGTGLVDTAKALKIDPNSFINLDTTNTAIRYKKMAPIVIASRLKTMVADCEDEDEKKKLLGFIAELEMAHQHGIVEGKCELINWTSLQSKNTIQASLGVYNLYSSNGKPVCDFVLISTKQQRTIDKTTVGLGWCTAAAIAALFVPVVGPVLITGLVVSAVAAAKKNIKGITTKEQGDIVMLKTLEHYGLIRLIGNDQIQLVND